MLNSSAIRRTAAPLRVQVTNAIRDLIVESLYKPGQRLIEADLCERFEVSRTVVREALRQLEAEGLVFIVPNRGPEVATLSIKEAESLYEVRRALESLAGELFALRASKIQRKNLEKYSEQVVRTVLGESTTHNLLQTKNDYYKVLFEGSENSEIERMLLNIHARTQMLRVFSLQSPNRSEKTVEEIREITKWAVAGDAEKTRYACEAHVKSAAQAALAQMKENIVLP